LLVSTFRGNVDGNSNTNSSANDNIVLPSSGEAADGDPQVNTQHLNLDSLWQQIRGLRHLIGDFGGAVKRSDGKSGGGNVGPKMGTAEFHYNFTRISGDFFKEDGCTHNIL
jgi:hypothetical protein